MPCSLPCSLPLLRWHRPPAAPAHPAHPAHQTDAPRQPRRRWRLRRRAALTVVLEVLLAACALQGLVHGRLPQRHVHLAERTDAVRARRRGGGAFVRAARTGRAQRQGAYAHRRLSAFIRTLRTWYSTATQAAFNIEARCAGVCSGQTGRRVRRRRRRRWRLAVAAHGSWHGVAFDLLFVQPCGQRIVDAIGVPPGASVEWRAST